MGRPDLGTLKPGAVADLAIFRLEQGRFTYYDIFMEPRTGTQRLVNTATFIAGEQLEHLPERPPEPFATLPERQRAILSAQPTT
jgi:dihydroorotase